eukprot:822964-Pelagomonas_calceolata.AAC.11
MVERVRALQNNTRGGKYAGYAVATSWGTSSSSYLLGHIFVQLLPWASPHLAASLYCFQITVCIPSVCFADNAPWVGTCPAAPHRGARVLIYTLAPAASPP